MSGARSYHTMGRMLLSLWKKEQALDGIFPSDQAENDCLWGGGRGRKRDFARSGEGWTKFMARLEKNLPLDYGDKGKKGFKKTKDENKGKGFNRKGNLLWEHNKKKKKINGIGGAILKGG